MNNEELQIETEWQVLRDYCKLTDQDPDDFCKENPPSADFRHKDGSVVLELVEYFRGSGSQGSSRLRKKKALAAILKKAKNLYASLALGRCNVFVGPGNNVPLTGLDEGLLAEKLTKIILQYEGAAVLLEGVDVPEDLRSIFSSIDVTPVSLDGGEGLWKICEAGILDVICSAVEDAINRKNKKVCKYHENSPAEAKIQLLIYSGFMLCIGSEVNEGTPANYGRVTDALRNSQFEMSFDEVFFMDRQKPELVSLLKSDGMEVPVGVCNSDFDDVKKSIREVLLEICTLVYTLEELCVNKKTVSLMNEAAPDFFRQYQLLLVDKIFLELTKLYDPKGDRRGMNVSLPHLVSLVSPTSDAPISELNEAKALLGNLPIIRNKLLAHNDAIYVGGDLSVSMDTVKDTLKASKKLFLMCCGRNHYIFKPFKYPVRQLENLLNRFGSKTGDAANTGTADV